MNVIAINGSARESGNTKILIEKVLEEFLPQVDTMPALVQNETHLYYQENDVIPYIQNLGIVMHEKHDWY